MSFEALEYVQKTRTTKAATPKPATNPLQFVQIKPCNLYQSAQEQLKRAEEVKKVKEVVKEDPEDWQSVSIWPFLFNFCFLSLQMREKKLIIIIGSRFFFLSSASHLCGFCLLKFIMYRLFLFHLKHTNH